MKRISFADQGKLLKAAARRGRTANDALSELGLSLDCLRYATMKRWAKAARPLPRLADHALRDSSIPAVSFFAGGGGLDLGFEAAGFSHLLSVEINRVFCETLRHNRPQWNIACEDVSNRERCYEVVRKAIGGSSPFAGVFHGGPPCQPFSIAANQRFSKNGTSFKRIGFDDSRRGTLLFDYVWLISQFKPRAFLLENVPGLGEVDGGIQLASAMQQLRAAGYSVAEPKVINSSDYGVPQERKRLFILGVRGRRTAAWNLEPRACVPCSAAFVEPVEGLPNHLTRSHLASSVLRYMQLDYGAREKLGRVDRLDPDKPSKTVIAGGSGGGGRSHLHPEIPRTLSARETARIQTFPDDYVFCGPSARQINQVGNSVPPVLAVQIAAEVRHLIGASQKRKSG